MEVKYEWSYSSTSLIYLHDVEGKILPFAIVIVTILLLLLLIIIIINSFVPVVTLHI